MKEYDVAEEAYKNGYDKGYSAGYTASNWISVEDKLPEPYTMVLVYTGYKTIDMIFYSEISGWNRCPNVTHWMPLPQPPKRKGN